MSAGSSRTGNPNYRHSLDAEMVDIDLEGGKADSFGSTRMSGEEQAAQYRDERLAISPVEHRRMSPVTSPHQSRPNSPSPLSIESTPFDYDTTPRATPREEAMTIPVLPTSFNPIRPPPRLGSTSDRGMRATTPDGEGKDKEVVRGSYRRDLEHRERERPRGERESSIISVDSQEGLLGESGASSRNNSPPPFISPATSPAPMMTSSHAGSAGAAGPLSEAVSPTVAAFPSTITSSDSIRAPVPGNQTKHKPTGSIVAQRRKALEDAMGGLDVKGGK